MARTTTVILGDLEPTPDQLGRIQALTPDVALTRSTDPLTVSALLADARHVIACNFDLNPYLSELTAVELVVLAETGIACLDARAADEAGVRYTNLPGYSSSAVVQYALRCVLESLRPWGAVFAPYVPGSREHKIGRSVDGLEVGLVGFGGIGRGLAAALVPLGANVHATTRRPFRHATVPWLPLDETVARSDALVVCCDRNPTSIGLLDASSLRLLKRGAVVVSVAHRSVFDAAALRNTIQERPDVRFWLDFDPDTSDEAITAAKNVCVSPHIAFYTREVLRARVDGCIQRLEEFQQGREWRIAPKPNRRPAITPAVGWAPSPLEEVLRLGSRFYESASLFAAVELGAFEAMAGGPASLHAIADRCRVAPARLEGLLRALVSSGLVEQEWSGSFLLPDRYRELLVRGSRSAVAALEALQRYSYATWSRLAAAIRGEPVEPLQLRRSTDTTAAGLCTAGSDGVLSTLVPEILRRVELAPTRILDLGCGGAALTRRLLECNPGAVATLVDTASVLAGVRRQLEAEGLADRCELRATSYHDASAIDGDPDLVLLSNVLHMESPEKARELVLRCVRELRPGGRIFVLGYFLHDVSEADAFLPHFSLSCELLTDGGACHPLQSVAAWLRDSGCRAVEHVPITVYRDALLATKHAGAHP